MRACGRASSCSRRAGRRGASIAHASTAGSPARAAAPPHASRRGRRSGARGRRLVGRLRRWRPALRAPGDRRDGTRQCAGAPPGRRTRAQDRLVAAYAEGAASGQAAPELLVEAFDDGWWYTMALGNGRRAFVCMTDADIGPQPAPDHAGRLAHGPRQDAVHVGDRAPDRAARGAPPGAGRRPVRRGTGRLSLPLRRRCRERLRSDLGAMDW